MMHVLCQDGSTNNKQQLNLEAEKNRDLLIEKMWQK
jgi:hypothetical protein